MVSMIALEKSSLDLLNRHLTESFTEQINWRKVSQTACMRIKPTSIPDLKAVVEDFVESIDPAIIRKACASAIGRSLR